MAFFWNRKKKKKGYRLPPPPPAELVEAIRETEITASRQLSEAEARELDIDARHDRLAKIDRENALGPRFWRAVGENRGT